MKHICDKCIFKTVPQSISDYYKKTLLTPCIHFWGRKGFEHRYWLCSNPNVSVVDHVNDSMIYKPCKDYNLHGNCTYFKTSDAENILPSSVVLKIEKYIDDKPVIILDEEPIYIDDVINLSITTEPFTTPEITEEVVTEQQKTDEEENLIFDEYGNPVMETKTETVIIEPEFINNQDITCSYTWFKNGRKLFQKKTPVLSIDTSKESVDEYYCVVTQSIINNGDGGIKQVDVTSKLVTISVTKKEDSITEQIPENPDLPKNLEEI